jgi:hypothetical protein
VVVIYQVRNLGIATFTWFHSTLGHVRIHFAIWCLPILSRSRIHPIRPSLASATNGFHLQNADPASTILTSASAAKVAAFCSNTPTYITVVSRPTLVDDLHCVSTFPKVGVTMCAAPPTLWRRRPRLASS